MKFVRFTFEIQSDFLPILYAVLNRELKASKEIVADEDFVEHYPNLAKRAQRSVDNLSLLCDQLLEEF